MITVEIQGAKELIGQLDKLRDATGDLRLVDGWKDCINAFYKLEKAQFAGEGIGASGAWKALTPKYATWKSKKYGALPINQRTKALYRSLTSKTGDSVVDEQAQELTIGTTVSYSGYVQKARPVIDFTPEQEKQLLQPIEKKIRQLLQNLRLRG